MSAERRLGVLGGTFDPIHNGHLGAADAACAALDLQEVVVIPTHDPPHRALDPMASVYHRFAMAALAIDGRPGWRLSDMELTRPGPSYTAHTLRALHGQGWTPSQIFFILGSDAFAEIATWYDFPAVLNDAHFAVIARQGAATLREAWERLDPRRFANASAPAPDPGAFHLIDAETPDVSSTQIRTRLAARQSIDDLVPASVARYIEVHHLYDSAVDDLHGKTARIHR
jgi:nicotinate-nucleotide adenylyltransferase